jgi:hypothetical protein
MLKRLLSIFQPNDCEAVVDVCSQTSLCKSVARHVFSRFELDRHDEILNLLMAQKDNRLFHDPIEDLKEFRELIELAESTTDAELQHRKRAMGFCHLYWSTKKRLLHQSYGIDWLSPSDMNPLVKFD